MLVRNSCQLKIKRVESRSRAMIATLKDKENEKILCVCSVHLDADKSADPKRREHHQNQRKSQLKSLLKRINYACKLERQKISEVPILLAGDFNMLRENQLHELLTEGTLTGSPGARVMLRDAYYETERGKGYSIPVYDQSSLNEGEISEGNENLVKTYKGGAILDYIWTSEKVEVMNTLLIHPSSSIVGMEKWPCHDHPSDHLPIGIDVEWN